MARPPGSLLRIALPISCAAGGRRRGYRRPDVRVLPSARSGRPTASSSSAGGCRRARPTGAASGGSPWGTPRPRSAPRRWAGDRVKASGVVRRFVVVARRRPVGLRRPVQRHRGAEVVLAEAALDIAVAIAPRAALLEDPRAEARRGIIERERMEMPSIDLL